MLANQQSALAFQPASSRKKLLVIVKNFGKCCYVDGRMLPAVKSQHSSPDLFVCVGEVGSVGIQQGCVLSQLIFMMGINRTDSHSRVDEGVTDGSCRINRFFLRTI